MAPIFQERSANREPSGRFGVDTAEWRRTYVLYEQAPDGSDRPIRSQDVYDRINLIIGGTNPGPSPRALGAPGGAGSVDRVMPMADPQFCGLYADVPSVRINNMEDFTQDQYGLGGLLAVPPIVPGFNQYKGVEFDIPFVPRPYCVLPNDRMVMDTREWFDFDGTRRYLRYYPEWLRHVQTFVDDLDSRLSASVGSALALRVPSNNPPGVDGSAFPGIPDMVVPDQKYVLRWYQVPLRYLTSNNSYLVKYKGTVNQWATFRDKPPGSLLFMGAKSVKTYTPPQFLPTQQPTAVDGFMNVLQGSFFAEPLVDFELTFYYTARRVLTADQIPDVERPNKNWIADGFNAAPHFHSKKFFYAHAKTDQKNDYANWVPQYLSIPHAFLFQDPDVPGLVFTP